MIKSLVQRIKLFSSDRKEFYLFLKNILGFYPRNLRLYDIAFIHKSASVSDPFGVPINNERLEYLGDAVLGAVVADFLYNRFPHKDEGFLTQMRSKLVNRIFLTQLTYELGLDRFVRAKSAHVNIQGSHIYGDALEALIGAIYIDRGFEKAKFVIVKRIICPYVDLNKLADEDCNYKSQLIEWGQKNKCEVAFHTDEEISENHRHSTFVSTIEIENEIKGRGLGVSKKEAQQNAAREALVNLEKWTPSKSHKEEDDSNEVELSDEFEDSQISDLIDLPEDPQFSDQIDINAEETPAVAETPEMLTEKTANEDSAELIAKTETSDNIDSSKPLDVLDLDNETQDEVL